MPDFVMKELWALVPTVIYFAVSLVMFGISIWLMEKLCPFSIRKEIEEDQNTSLGILMGAALIALAIVIASVISSESAASPVVAP